MKTLIISIVLICAVRRCISYSVYDFNFNSIKRFNCCDRNLSVDAYSINKCEDGSPIRLLSCTKTKIFDPLSFDLIDRQNETFLITEDYSGDEIEAKELTVKYPYFCIGTRIFRKNNSEKIGIPLAIACVRIIESKELIISYISLVLNTLSLVLLLTACLLYYTLANLRDAHGRIIFHICLTWVVLHVKVIYRLLVLLSDTTTMDLNLCFVDTYIEAYIVLVACIWSAILSYHTWLQTRKNNLSHDDALRVKLYKIIAYGIPVILVIFANIHARIKYEYPEDEDDVRRDEFCEHHGEILQQIYVFIPGCSVLLLVVVFLLHSYIRLSKLRHLQIRNHSRGLRYRTLLNAKLLAATGIPLAAALILFYFFNSSFRESAVPLKIELNVLIMAVSGEGTFIFLISVVFRKRVLKAVSRSGLLPCFFNVQSKWKNIIDSEDDNDRNAAIENNYFTRRERNSLSSDSRITIYEMEDNNNAISS